MMPKQFLASVAISRFSEVRAYRQNNPRWITLEFWQQGVGDQFYHSRARSLHMHVRSLAELLPALQVAVAEGLESEGEETVEEVTP